MTIQEYFGDGCKIIDIKEAERLTKRLIDSKQFIYPKIKNIFKAFASCSLHGLKVSILGLSPYPDIRKDKPTATTVVFGNYSDTIECNYSPSLDVLMESVIDFTHPHGNIIFDHSLEKWEDQRVLLLNSALSCQAGKISSYTLVGRPFIKSFLTNLSNYDSDIIYMLMGSEAQSLEPYINSKYNHVIKINHLSGFARTHTKMPSDLWYLINGILKDHYGFSIK